MKIYFCDICNESIPLKDINSNRITIEEGKIFCQKCAPRKARAGERIPGVVIAGLGVLALAVALGGFLGWRTLSTHAAELESLRASAGGMERDLGAVPERLAGLTGHVRSLEAELGKVRDDLTLARTELQRRFQGLDDRERANDERLKQETQEALQRGLGGVTKQVMTLEQGLLALKERVLGEAEDLKSLEDKVQDMLKLIIGSANPAPARAEREAGPGEGAPAGAPGADALEEREVNAHIAALADPDPGKRYSAVIALGRYSGDKVVTALLGRIKDQEDYVRVAVIQNLRKLGAKASIPHVIEALRDPDYFVRVAARGALKALVESSLDYDPDGSPGDRENQVKAWERWWTDNKDRVLRDASGS